MSTPASEIKAPYPGLRPFLKGESHLFYGRHRQVADMLMLLKSRRFLAVVGSSGSGKSSLVRAGLLPAITDGFLSVSSVNPDAEPGAWHVVTMMPGTGGAGPKKLNSNTALRKVTASQRLLNPDGAWPCITIWRASAETSPATA